MGAVLTRPMLPYATDNAPSAAPGRAADGLPKRRRTDIPVPCLRLRGVVPDRSSGHVRALGGGHPRDGPPRRAGSDRPVAASGQFVRRIGPDECLTRVDTLSVQL